MKSPAETLSLFTPEIVSGLLCQFPYQYTEYKGIQEDFDYQFTISGNKYITVRTGNRTGPVVGTGYADVTITAPSDENLFVHWSIDSDCSPNPSATLCKGITTQCVSCGPQCPDLGLNIVDPCDDANPNTYDDSVTEDCQCTGITYPTNDDPCTAITLSCGDTVMQYFVGLTPTLNDNCPGNSLADAWLKFTADGEHLYTVGEGDGTILSFDAVVQLFKGDLCTGLVPLGPCRTYPESFSVHQAGTYYYRIRPISTFDEANYPAQVHLTCQTVDCSTLGLDVGDPCDDSDPFTENDVVNPNCQCAGAPVPCDGPLAQATGMAVQLLDNGALATWNPVSGAVVCQHRLKRLSDGAVLKNFVQQQPQSGTILVPYALFDPGTTYRWAIWCGCSADPNLAGPWNALTFTTPGGQQVSSSPNPVTPKSVVTFSVEKPQSAQLEVYDLNGRRLQTLYQGHAAPGSDLVFDFDVSGLPQGVYVYKLTTPTAVTVTKFIVTR